MKESIHIKNFGGIKNETIELAPINIFIGKQASGKSVVAKLLYFFRGIFDLFPYHIRIGTSANSAAKSMELLLKKYFPPSYLGSQSGEVLYNIDGNNCFTITFTKGNLSVVFSPFIDKAYQKILADYKESQQASTMQIDIFNFGFPHQVLDFEKLSIPVHKNSIFIPAGRAFFTQVESSIFELLSKNNPIDPFLIEFGKAYNRIKLDYERIIDTTDNVVYKKYIDIFTDILGSQYVKDDEKEFLVHNDNRKVLLRTASSGQQEVLPIFFVLFKMAFDDAVPTDVYIEEPEAHLFPTTQKQIVDLIGITYNKFSQVKYDARFIITTHSPYILTSFNNLIQRANAINALNGQIKNHSSLTDRPHIGYDDINAFEFKNGKISSLKDNESKLLSADIIDGVSEEIAEEFDELLDIKYNGN